MCIYIHLYIHVYLCVYIPKPLTLKLRFGGFRAKPQTLSPQPETSRPKTLQ